ncbi:hypothetical protein [Planococcus rifietoensis]|uniref:hypothetical protein n=1 Tax=Planococcus rifietoensis TaxID=200991 RepID=UPI00384D563E
MNELVERDHLISLIKYINNLHKIQSLKWIDSTKEPINLKTRKIRDLFSESESNEQNEANNLSTEFLKYLNVYCDNLNMLATEPEFDLLPQDLHSRSRVKDPDSRVAKLLHYMNGKSEAGKVGINKCLNDLMGFRVWLNDHKHGKHNCELLKEELSSEGVSVRVHDSCKEDYKATHIYFSNENNKFFPWELQIWNHKDHESNISSHSEHKQGYTKWVENYKQ